MTARQGVPVAHPDRLDHLDRLDLIDLLGLGSALAELDLEAVARMAAVDPGADSPYPEEQALVARAVPARRAELLSGRDLARAALDDLGLAPVAIGRREDRSPDWPAGIVGSITHADGLVCVVVARPRHPGSSTDARGHRVGIGIDAERDHLLAPAVADRVLGDDERVALTDRADDDAVVVFSAKESVFKALNPLTGRWLEPADVTIGLDPGRFTAALTPVGAEPDDPSRLDGGWVRQAGWVFTGCVARAIDRPAIDESGGPTGPSGSTGPTGPTGRPR